MKKLLLLLLLSLGFIGSVNAKICDETSNVQKRNGVLYLPNQEQPFSGENLCVYQNGQYQIQGEYTDGLKDGKWTSWGENGIKKTEVIYDLGSLKSKTIFNSKNYKQAAIINYRNGNEISKIEWSYFSNGQMNSEKNYKDGKLDGKQTEWFENGQKESEKYYENGKKSLSVVWFESGIKHKEIEYKDDKLHGKWIFWHENGQKKQQGNYIDGKMYGKWLFWHENGQLNAEAYFKDGKFDGKLLRWHENGQIEREVNLTESKVKDSKAWYNNGQVRFFYICIDGLPVGVSGWKKNGLKYDAGGFKDGTGSFISLHENGNKRYEVHFKDGIQVSYIFWWENGNKKEELVNKDGEVKTTYWNEDGTFDKEDNKINSIMCIQG